MRVAIGSYEGSDTEPLAVGFPAFGLGAPVLWHALSQLIPTNGLNGDAALWHTSIHPLVGASAGYTQRAAWGGESGAYDPAFSVTANGVVAAAGDSYANRANRAYQFFALFDDGAGDLSWGTYEGTGASHYEEHGLGETPAAILTFSMADVAEANRFYVWWHSGPNRGWYLSTGSDNGYIRNVGSTQFEVTTSPTTNEAGRTFAFVALKNSDVFGALAYTPTGSPLPVTGAGFRPSVVAATNDDGTGLTTAAWSMWGTEAGLYPGRELPSDGVVSLDADGFTLGTYAGCNFNGAGYGGVAWCFKHGSSALGGDLWQSSGIGTMSTSGSLSSIFAPWDSGDPNLTRMKAQSETTSVNARPNTETVLDRPQTCTVVGQSEQAG